MRSGELSLAVEIPPGYGRDLKRGASPAIGVWIDGSMPTRANTVAGYVQGMHLGYLAELARQSPEGAARVPPASRCATATTRMWKASRPWCRR